ncbi:MAG: hypothetical protein ACI8RZ_002340 [Myxococcota bacterium]|jgi:hypothetical protein
MNDEILTTLTTLLSVHGSALLDAHRRLEGLLRDMHPDEPLAVSVLVEAVECGVVVRLRADPRSPQQPLVAMLTEGSGLALRPATWAVDTWRELLGDGLNSDDGDRGSTASTITHRPGSLEAVLAGQMEKR